MKIATRARLSAAILAVVLAAGAPVLADYEEGMSAFKAKKYSEAAANFQALVDQSPAYDFGYYMLGLSFFKMGKYDDAVKNIQEALKLNPDKFDYHHGLASVRRAQKKNMEAIRVLNEAEGLVPASHKFAFYSLRGFCYADLSKWGEAVEDLEAARAVRKSAPVLEYLGKAYFKLGHNDKAAPVLREAIRINPNDAKTHMLLAESLIELGREARSEASKKKLYAEAVQVANKYRSMEPGTYESFNLVGKAALGGGDFKAAEEAFLKVLSMKPDYCWAMINLSKVYIAQDRWKDAESQSKKAAECAPRMAVAYDNLGFALQKQDRLEEALAAYKKANQIEPSPSVQKRIGIVEENIRVREENKKIAELEKKQEDAAAEEERKYQENLAKQKEWEKKRDE